jgi:hypothetical protein
LPHSTFADLRGDVIGAEASAGSQSQSLLNYTGSKGCGPCSVLKDADLRAKPLACLASPAGGERRLSDLGWASSQLACCHRLIYLTRRL